MAIPSILPCDGCGQLASADHIARRLQRLEWATRFRPIHMQALLLAAAPETDEEFLYSPNGSLGGQAAELLAALSITTAGKSSEEVLGEVQKRGLYLSYALECPVEPDSDTSVILELLDRHMPHAIARIRRSLKPKRVLILSPELQPLLAQFTESALGCPVFYTPISLPAAGAALPNTEITAFRAALSALAAHGT